MTDHSANIRILKTIGFLLAIFASAFSISFCGIGLGLYAGALALQPLVDRNARWQTYPSWKFLLPLLTSLLISVAISDYRWISAQGFGKYVQGFLLLYAGIDVIRTEKDKKILVFTLVSACLFALASGLYQEFSGIDLIYGNSANIYQGNITRLTGSFKHCNDFGTFLVPSVVFALAHFLGLSRQKKYGAAFLALLLLTGLCYVLMRTISRSAILSAFAALFIFCLFFRFRWHALFFLAAALAALWFVPSPLCQRLHELTSLGGGDMAERTILLRTSLDMVRENPFFGLGLNTYSDHFPKFKPADYPALMYAHNTYLQMATEAGLVGVGLFLIFVGAVMARCIKQKEMLGAALWAGVVGILVNGLFDSVLQSTQLRTLFWALLGAAAALSRL